MASKAKLEKRRKRAKRKAKEYRMQRDASRGQGVSLPSLEQARQAIGEVMMRERLKGVEEPEEEVGDANST